jgi:UPF0755 protein
MGRRARLALLLALGLGTVAVVATLEAERYWRESLDTPLQLNGQTMNYRVEQGSALRSVAEELAGHGVLQRPWILVLEARLQGTANRIHAGEYALEPGLTPRTLLARLVAGQVLQHGLTLVEGWTFQQMLSAVWRSPNLARTLDEAAPGEIMARLGYPGEHPEGRFFPDTYRFPSGTTDAAFLKRALRTMDGRLADEWRSRQPGLPLQTPYDALVLASIVEKETGVAAERARIAGVFIERLRKGMRLESDPTVIYGLGAGFDGNLRREDLRRPTPYNTYVHKGLPPTPIAAPGLDSLRSVLHPDADGSLFFVAKGDGTHHFSDTFEEHQRAVHRYQIKASTGTRSERARP